MLTDEDLEKEIESYDALSKRLRSLSGAPIPVINQSEKMLELLRELSDWRKLGNKIYKLFDIKELK